MHAITHVFFFSFFFSKLFLHKFDVFFFSSKILSMCLGSEDARDCLPKAGRSKGVIKLMSQFARPPDT